MKYKILIMLSILMILITPQIAKSDQLTPDELYFNQTHLISIKDVYNNVFTFDYVLRQDGMYDFKVLQNGNVFPGYGGITETTDVAYFYLREKDKYHDVDVYTVGYKWWNNTVGWHDVPSLTQIWASGFDYEVEPGPPSGQYDHLKGNIKITEPPYDYWTTTDSRIKVKYSFGLPKPIGDYDITINGGSEVIGSNKLVTTNEDDNWKYYYYEVYLDLMDSQNTITIYIDHNNETYSASRIIQRYFGVVDENDDGIDDRTGLPITGENIDIGDAPVMPGDDATVLDWIKWIFQSISWLLTSMINAIKTIGTSLGDLSAAITKIFAFMPSGLLPLMIFGLTIAIILRILKR